MSAERPDMYASEGKPSMPSMELNTVPKNAERFEGLMVFLKEVLEMTSELDVEVVLSSSLAALAYTKDSSIDVNDVDLACPEAEFARLAKAADERGIRHVLKDWHVLQLWKDDLKIDFDSMEFWLKDLPQDYILLQIDDLKLPMVSLPSLKELYRRGLEDTAHDDQINRKKRSAIKNKLELLSKL